MKRITYITLLILLPAFIWAQKSEYYYYADGEKRYLELNTEYIGVSSGQQAVLHKMSNSNLQLGEVMKNNDRLTMSKDLYRSEVALKEKLTPIAYKNKLEQMKADHLVVTPYFKSPAGGRIGLSDNLYVKLQEEADIVFLEKTAKENKLQIVEQNKFMPLWFVLSVTPETGKNSLEMANILYETKRFASAQPDFTYKFSAQAEKETAKEKSALAAAWDSSCSNDPAAPYQWGLEAINACDAWTFTDPYIPDDMNNPTEGAGIVVAIVGDGIESARPDLTANIHPVSYDIPTGGSARVYGLNGTVAAGIIGAVRNNGFDGVGVAPKCKLMAVSYDVRANYGTAYYAAQGIGWAWRNGAHVIDNPWIWGYNLIENDMLNDAIWEAKTMGRGGLGCTVVFPVNDMAYNTEASPERREGVISVGAVGYGMYRTANSYDENTPDIVAPNLTNTFIVGDWDTINGYIPYYSASASYVSGVAALVLSHNQRMSNSEVKEIILQSAKKISTYTFENIPDRGYRWNSTVGYGLLDAFRARSITRTDIGGYPGIEIASFPYPYACEGDLMTFRTLTSAQFATWHENDNFFLLQSTPQVAQYLVLGSGNASVSASFFGWLYNSPTIRIGALDPCEITGFETNIFTAGNGYWFSVANPNNEATGYEWSVSGDAVIENVAGSSETRKFVRMNIPTGVRSTFTLTLSTLNRCGASTFSQTGNIIRRVSSVSSIEEGNNVKVYSVNGSLLYNGTSNGSFDINSTNLSEGIYILETTDAEGNAVREKVMLNR